ncbi:MAG: hypothetical protein CVU48_03675 [Candidatus Cloacimonetes bacterium HGW-Cloacimonetes-1]|nr:MAG: hypothetical protein CVU48_03675 [Candidatus Cloacimonetes bacterium HGW-Cloacimonetes-1]
MSANRYEPSDENAFNLALIELNLCHYQTANRIMEELRSRVTNNPMLLVSLGQSYLLLNRWDDATDAFGELTKLYPHNATFASLLSLSVDAILRDKYRMCLDLQYQASILADSGKAEEALEQLKTAADLAPQDAVLMNNIGVLMLRLKKDPKATLHYFAKAVELSPNNDNFKRTYRKVWQKQKPQNKPSS